MRYTSAVVLSTLAVGQATAATLHNRHASFHERRQAEVKRNADEVDWSKVALDLKDVNWSTINWKSVFASPTPTPAAPAKAAATPEQQQKPAYTPEQKQPVPAVTTPTPSAAQPTHQSETVGDKVADFLESMANSIGAKVGKNDKSDNGGIWIGTDSAWGAQFINNAGSDAIIYCWKADGYSGMSVNVHVPDVSYPLKAGQKVDLSFAPNVPSACAPAFADTKLALFGGLFQTWWEVTFGNYGTFDVSRNVNMNGHSISSQGSQCKSDMNTCVFKCKDPAATSCKEGNEYDLFACSASSGGGGGYDKVMKGTGGGCTMGASGEKVTVTFS